MLDEDENEVKFELPARYEVCSRCDGHGKHVNPSIDSNGITQSEFDEDPEFRDAYFSGRYDVDCHNCNGKRVQLILDMEAIKASKEHSANFKIVDEYQKEEIRYEQMCRSERMFGA